MTMDFGYALSTVIFFGLFLVVVTAQIRARSFHPFLYWLVIVATTTAGTTLADFFDRSLGIGYIGGSLCLLALLATVLATWWFLQAPSRLTISPHPLPRRSTGRRSSPRTRSAPHWATSSPMTAGWATRAAPSSSLSARPGRRGLLLDQPVAHPTLLGRLHPDPAAGRHGWRPAGQARLARRVGPEPRHRITGPRGLMVPWSLSPRSGRAGTRVYAAPS